MIKPHQNSSYIIVLIISLFIHCDSTFEEETVVIKPFQLEALSAPFHYPGIAIYTADMGKNKVTEVNSEWVIRNSSSVMTTSEIKRNKFNAIHKINFENIRNTTDYLEFVVALFGKMINRNSVPSEFLKDMNGIRFRSVSFDKPLTITLDALDINGVVLKSQNFEIKTDKMHLYTMDLNNPALHHLSFKILKSTQNEQFQSKGSFGIDDIYITTSSNTPFSPPSNDAQLLTWLKKSSIHYFLWNYRNVGGNRGVVLESNEHPTMVSLSGIGYAYAMFILAENEGMINADEAKEKILSLLNWQKAQNWFDSSQGKFGFPFHYYHSDGSGLYTNSPEAVSTIDWAICAAGIRTVKQKYASDAAIVSICDELLNRPQWEETIHTEQNDSYRFGRISKGLHGVTGIKNNQVWADAFSEETEIIYLEGLASGKVDNLDLAKIFRQQKNGMYVSWFGAGFTYNWLQLWTGMQEPYQSNSMKAYQVEVTTASSKFNTPLIGLTACSTISDVTSSGFVNWNRYISNQGSSVSGANTTEVIQISPAPYGAALAIPFIPNTALIAIKEYIKIGYYHPLLGLPDNIRMGNLPNGLSAPIPNWTTFDINIAPIGMAIEMHQNNVISKLYMKDVKVISSLEKLKQSF